MGEYKAKVDRTIPLHAPAPRRRAARLSRLTLPVEVRRFRALAFRIVCLDGDGRAQFYDLFYYRASPVFIAFDILARGRDDLQMLPLVVRKQELRRVLAKSSRVLYGDHVEGSGITLFERVCALDLEGIVAKHRWGPYTSDADASTWFKIRNRNYSQWAGRNEAFERDRHTKPVAGWHACELASAAALT